MADESLEFRLSSSDDQRVRWMFGYSDTDIEWFTQNIGSMIVYYPNDGVDNTNRGNPPLETPHCHSPYYVFYGQPRSMGNVCGNYGDITSNNNDFKWDSINTSAFYASIEADITDKLTVSVDVRRQEDDVT
jgi:hypothetical protein